MGKNVHIVRSKNGEDWSVKSENSLRAFKNASTQKEAIEIGKSVAKNNGVELLIHGKDGRIREKNAYGNDSYPPKG